jgi:heptaprenylglyceryl phosphate synthase
LGMKTIFMDAGSGAEQAISTRMIQTVSSQLSIPLIIGGGIRTPEKAAANVAAGADVIVIGNAIEKDPTLLIELSDAVHSTVPNF